MTVRLIDHPDRRVPAWRQLLSPRETEVLRLIAQGHTNTEIADALCIAMPTVKSHVAQLLRKMRARDRVALVVAAYASGLVSVEPAAGGEAHGRCCAAVRRGPYAHRARSWG